MEDLINTTGHLGAYHLCLSFNMFAVLTKHHGYRSSDTVRSGYCGTIFSYFFYVEYQPIF